MNNNNITSITGKTAGLLSLIEIGLGSILHAFKIPFSGQFLSLNQGFIIARTTYSNRYLEGAKFLPAHISFITALLKSLSPAGQRLIPMLAISAQGLLFNLSTLLFGINFFSILIGYLLLSLWAFFQPIAYYYFLFGETIINVADFYLTKLQKYISFEQSDLWMVLGIVICIKLFLATVLSIAICFLPDRFLNNYDKSLIKAAKRTTHSFSIDKKINQKTIPSLHIRLMHSFKDLLNPLFLISIIFTALFFIYGQTDSAQTIWILLRPIALAYILFFIIRSISFDNLILKIENGHYPKLAKSLSFAIEFLKK